MKYSFKTKVRFSESDKNLQLTLPGILTYFEDCSIFHSESIGMGIDYMLEEGHMWILSSWQIIIDRYPKYLEEVTVSTWAYGWKGFYGYRNFMLEDADGNRIAYANTIWLYTNIRTGRPDAIPQNVSDAYSCEPQIEMEVAPRKIKVPAGGEHLEPFAVRKSDIDLNEHVNNERYILFASEYLPEGFVTKELRAEYKMSAKYGDIIHPVVITENDRIIVVLKDQDDKAYATVMFIGE